MTIWEYPVTFVYGYSAAYGPTFHSGQDRTAPKGTPITVNGVTIGLSGNTGLSTGPHCHIGKWKGGTSSDPAGGGATFNSAVVTEIHPNDTDNNGKYVRVDGDGYSWVYLHMDSIGNIKVGDKLEGGSNVNGTPNDGDITNGTRFAKQDPTYQPPGPEFDYYKDPKNGWKALYYDTQNAVQPYIDSLLAQGSGKFKPYSGDQLYVKE